MFSVLHPLCARLRGPAQTFCFPGAAREAWCSLCGDEQTLLFPLCSLGTLLVTTHECLRNIPRWARRGVSLQCWGGGWKSEEPSRPPLGAELASRSPPVVSPGAHRPASLPGAGLGFPSQLVAQPQAQCHLFTLPLVPAPPLLSTVGGVEWRVSLSQMYHFCVDRVRGVCGKDVWRGQEGLKDTTRRFGFPFL